MLSILTRVTIPHGSRRRTMAGRQVQRLKRYRSITYLNNRYNLSRQNYYKHQVTKILPEAHGTVSIVVPCYNTPARYFEPLLSSILAQGYADWQFVLVDASDSERSSEYLQQKSLSDIRIKYVRAENKGIAHNTNVGLAAANGAYVAFMDHDDTIDANALAESIALFQADTTVSLVYSDEDKLSDTGDRFFEPHFKPDFSLDMLRNVNYINHLTIVKKELVDKLDGLRTGFEGAQDFDFLLRAVDAGAIIGHVPKVLYHWRQAEGSTAADFSNKAHITDAGVKALKDHYKRNAIKEAKPYAIKDRPGFYAATYDLPEAKRSVYVNFTDFDLTNAEKTYILSHYYNNNDVKKHNIAIMEGLPDSSHQHTLIVNGPFIPAHKTTRLINMFGLAQENGVARVGPKIVRHGKIFDMGTVHTQGKQLALFRGVNPGRPQFRFGSLEWVRNVDNVNNYVSIKGVANEGRNIIWSHVEFVALLKPVARQHSSNGYYNPNLAESIEIVEETDDYIADLIEIDT